MNKSENLILKLPYFTNSEKNTRSSAKHTFLVMNLKTSNRPKADSFV